MACALQLGALWIASWRVIRLQRATLFNCRLYLCLFQAGCALLAVHARYRGSATRRRDGPAQLEQVAAVKAAVGDLPVLSNGNVRTAEELIEALAISQALHLRSFSLLSKARRGCSLSKP